MINSIYLNLSENYLNSMSSPEWNKKQFTEVKYETIHSGSGICERHAHFNFIQSSTTIKGFKAIQTFFVKTNSNNPLLKYIECSVYDLNCTCISMEDEHKTIFKKCNKSFYLNVILIGYELPFTNHCVFLKWSVTMKWKLA
jgi:hypothetical protein